MSYDHRFSGHGDHHMYNHHEDRSYNRAQGYGDYSRSNGDRDISSGAYIIRLSTNQRVCPREIVGTESE